MPRHHRKSAAAQHLDKVDNAAADIGVLDFDERLIELQALSRTKPAGADPVRALFAFLNLLKGQPELVAKLFLAHANKHSAHAYPIANMNVDRVGVTFCHVVSVSSPARILCIVRAPVPL